MQLEGQACLKKPDELQEACFVLSQSVTSIHNIKMTRKAKRDYSKKEKEKSKAAFI